MVDGGSKTRRRGAGWLHRGAAALAGGLLLTVATAAGLAMADDSALMLRADVAAAQTVAGSGAAAEPVAARSTRAISRPAIAWKPVPFGAKRKAEMAAYCKRHYGDRSYRLKPKLVVLHFTAGKPSDTWRTTWNYFANDVADWEFHELPGPAAHFIIDKDGTVYQLVGTSLRSRHTYGLNHVAIGIEFVQEGGSSATWADRQILARKPQVKAGLRLVRWLQKKYGIRTAQVIGHAMATQSKYYKDLLGRKNAHGDWQYVDVQEFRARLRLLN